MVPNDSTEPARQYTRPGSRRHHGMAAASWPAGGRRTDERSMRALEILVASAVLAGVAVTALSQPVDGRTVALLAGALVMLLAALIALLR